MKTILKGVLLLSFLFFPHQEGYAGGKMVAYVGGVNALVKIDMQTYKIIKAIELPSEGLHIVFGLDMSPSGKEIYATGDMFSAPMIVIDSKTLKIIRKLGEKEFEYAKFDNDFTCRGKLSPDGHRFAIDCGIGSTTPFAVVDKQTFKIIDKSKAFHSNPIYQSVFSNDNKLLYVLTGLQIKDKKPILENKIIIIDSDAGKILKEFSLPKFEDIKCETNISEYIGDRSDVYITCNKNFSDSHSSGERGLLKGNDVYPFVNEKERKKIKLIEVKTGEAISEIPVPAGKGDLNFVTLTPDKKTILICRGGYRHPGELTIVDVRTKKVITRIMLEGGATSNVVFGYE